MLAIGRPKKEPAGRRQDERGGRGRPRYHRPAFSFKETRGFTLLELTFGLALLTIAFGGAWLLLGSANRGQAVLWDELAANEIAVSALEQALGQDALEPTPPGGRVLDFQTGQKPQPLPNLKVMLHAGLSAERPDLCEVRAVVEWRQDPRATPRSVERRTTVRRRIR